MTPEPTPAAASRRRTGLTALIAVVAVAVAVPVGIAAWIGGILLAQSVGLEMSANQVFAWLMSAFVGLVLWPVLHRRAQLEFWRSAHGGRPPKITPTRADAAIRAVVMIAGAAALIAICGPQDIVSALSVIWITAAPGGRSSAALLQLTGLVLVALLMVPALLITGRALRRTTPDDPAHLRLQLRQNWYSSAALAWVGSLIIGILVGWLILTRL